MSTTTSQFESIEEEICHRVNQITIELSELRSKNLTMKEKHNIVQQQQIDGIINERDELTSERHRIIKLSKEYEEMFPSPTLEDCPICLETIINQNEILSYKKTLCCGNCICMSCESSPKLLNCPFCRANLPATNTEMMLGIENLAKKGDGWAMCHLGLAYEDGIWGYSINLQKALQWHARAADEKGIVTSMRTMGWYYSVGIDGVVEKSMPVTVSWIKRAADMGDAKCQATMGRLYFGELIDIVPEDEEEAIRYFTILVSKENKTIKDEEMLEASLYLGCFFQYGYGSLKKSYARAIFYLKRVARSKPLDRTIDLIAYSQELLAKFLLVQCQERYCGRDDIVGHSVIPKAMYWYRKSLHTSSRAGIEAVVTRVSNTIKQKTIYYQSFCGSCKKDANELLKDGIPLKNCARCKSIWYCSRRCKQDHWIKGHKIDCCRTEF